MALSSRICAGLLVMDAADILPAFLPLFTACLPSLPAFIVSLFLRLPSLLSLRGFLCFVLFILPSLLFVCVIYIRSPFLSCYVSMFLAVCQYIPRLFLFPSLLCVFLCVFLSSCVMSLRNSIIVFILMPGTQSLPGG